MSHGARGEASGMSQQKVTVAQIKGNFEDDVSQRSA